MQPLVYKKILKQAWQITRENRFLWIFGLFLIVGDLVSLITDKLPPIKNPPDYLIIVSVVITLLFLIFYFRCKAGLIIAIKATLDKQETSFKKAFKASILFVGQIFSITLKVGLGLAVIALILSAPIIYMFNHNFSYRGITLSVLALIIYAPIFILGMLTVTLAPLFAVIYDLKTNEAIARSFELIGKYWVTLTVMFFILGIIDLPLFLVNFVVGLRGGLAFTSVAIAFAIFQLIFVVFSQTAWILAFQDLVKPQKLADEEPVVVPEIIG
jgi:hypothetical protein